MELSLVEKRVAKKELHLAVVTAFFEVVMLVALRDVEKAGCLDNNLAASMVAWLVDN